MTPPATRWCRRAARRVAGADAASLVLAADASSEDGAYNGMSLRLAGGQSGIIYGYDGASRKATLQAPWSSAPRDGRLRRGAGADAGHARAGSTSALALDAAASSEDDAYGMTLELLLPPPPTAGARSSSNCWRWPRASTTPPRRWSADAMQQGNAMQGLADLLGTSAERLTALIPAATQATSLDDYLADLLTPLVDGQVPARLPPFIASLARGVVAFDALAFNAAEILAVAAIPQAFGIATRAICRWRTCRPSRSSGAGQAVRQQERRPHRLPAPSARHHAARSDHAGAVRAQPPAGADRHAGTALLADAAGPDGAGHAA